MSAHRIPTPPKTCEQCGATFERHIPAETPARFAARRFCGNSCSVAWRWSHEPTERRTTKRTLSAEWHAASAKANAERGARIRAERIEDAEWIIGTDHPENVARRLGYSGADTLASILRRWGREDLAARLTGAVAA